MSYSVNWITKVISVPTADLTLVSGTRYSLDMSDFLAEIRRLEWAFADGLWAPTVLDHTNTRFDFAGVNYAPFDDLLNDYTVQFTGIATRVDLLGSNNDIIDVLIPTGISVVPSNSAGLQIIEAGSGVTEEDKTDIIEGVWDESLVAHIVANSAATAIKAGTYILGSITLDIVNGTAGTGWPIGTHFKPSDNLTDALTIMFYGNVVDLVLMSSVTVGATHDISNKVLRTIGKMGIDVILSTGCTAHKTSFRNVNLSGIITSGNELLIYDCSIGNLENFRGIMSTVSFSQGSEITLNGWANIIQGSAGGEPTNEVEINIGTASLNMSHWTGNLKLTGKTGADRTVINCDSGNIIIDSTCVAGTIQILGTAIIEADNSGVGCTVDIDGLQSAENIAGLVWEELSDEHIAAGSFGELMASLIKLTGYKVTKSGDIITIYESNGTTVWRQYNLANDGRVEV